MHRPIRTLLIFFGFSLFVSLAHAETIQTPSAPVAATVFSDRATITREATIKIPAGKHTLVFNDLPLSLFPDSLRVEGEGAASVILGALSHKTINEAGFVDERAKELHARLENLNRQKNILNAEKAALNKQQEFYESLKAEASTKTKEEISEFKFNTEQWVLAADTILNGLENASKKTLEKNDLIKNIDEQLSKIMRDLAQLQTAQKSSTEVSLPVEAKSNTTLNIHLSYQLPNATWKPVYDARLDTKSGKLQIIQYGTVRQNTGEDWSNVALTLSTARPQRGASLPEPQPMWVNIPENVAKLMRGVAMESMGAADMAYMAAPAEMDEGARLQKAASPQAMIAATIAEARIETGGFTAEYKIPALNTVSSDGTESKLLIGTFKTENELETHVQPQFGTDAYLIAKATLQGENPILPGSVSLFLDDAYVGQSQLPLLRAGKSTRLSFGIDDQIEVKRQTLKDETGEAGIIIGMQNIIEREYNTEIHNLRQTPVNLVVLEPIPAPQNEKITIELLKGKTTKGFEEDAEKTKGLLRWKLELKPGEKKDIALGWKLAWPKDKQINGLPY
ncbi:MAG: mucoidy inhibitor MuiA family protein [Alphaproteobacteria bacterium]|nr:mucoidy inhibitor MuiA family protein [Alphaproteobacteria bacterium]